MPTGLWLSARVLVSPCSVDSRITDTKEIEIDEPDAGSVHEEIGGLRVGVDEAGRVDLELDTQAFDTLDQCFDPRGQFGGDQMKSGGASVKPLRLGLNHVYFSAIERESVKRGEPRRGVPRHLLSIRAIAE